MTLTSTPPKPGYFGAFGGRFVPETLVHALDELEAAYAAARVDDAFRHRFDALMRDYVGRETPLCFAERLSSELGGARIYLKREDLNHTGAHKINNAIGQALLAQRMGKRRIIAETGAGQHGVATATACALLGIECRVYMGAVDVRRQRPNVQRMRLLGAEVIAVESGGQTLQDAINEALREWVARVEDTHYCIGSVVGPHPFPTIVRDFQSVIGRETRRQSLARFGRLPHVIIACVGGGSNAMGIFHDFIDDDVRLIGVEAAGKGVDTNEHSATIGLGAAGVLHGARSMLLQDADGQVLPTHSISAGLDYPGVGPEHAHLADIRRVEYVSATDDEVLAAFSRLCRTEGIIPALESAHAVSHAIKLAPELEDAIIVVNLSGRGDKDLAIVEGAL